MERNVDKSSETEIKEALEYLMQQNLVSEIGVEVFSRCRPCPVVGKKLAACSFQKKLLAKK